MEEEEDEESEEDYMIIENRVHLLSNRPKQVAVVTSRHNPNLANTVGRIHSQPIKILVDSASTCTLIKVAVAKRLQLDLVNHKSTFCGLKDVSVVQGEQITSFTAEILFEESPPILLQTTAYLSENICGREGYDVLIGSNVLSSFSYAISHKGTLQTLNPGPNLRRITAPTSEQVLLSTFEEPIPRGINAE